MNLKIWIEVWTQKYIHTAAGARQFEIQVVFCREETGLGIGAQLPSSSDIFLLINSNDAAIRLSNLWAVLILSSSLAIVSALVLYRPVSFVLFRPRLR